MIDLWTWAVAHPWPAALIAATTLGTLLGRINTHYGADHPRLRRHLLFFIDLLTSWLPNLWPQKKKAAPGETVIADKKTTIGIVLVLLLTLGGCSAATSAAAKASTALAKAGTCAAQRIWEQCGPVARDCIVAQLGQCVGLQPKEPWVQPPPVCAPASAPSKP